MDESKGEGWHRETNYEAARSNNAGDALLLSVPRHKQNLKTCVDFVNNQPELSQKVFRYEWQHVKRIIRPSAFDRWKSVKVTDREFYERLNRLTDDADDWAKLLGIAAASVGGSGGGGSDENGGVGQARQDYLRKVLAPDAFFSVPVTQTGVDDCGAVREITKDSHFQVLNLQHDSSRPKVLNTIGDEDQDTVRKSALSVSIQYLSVWRRSTPADITCFSELLHSL
jgi:hypothetical protein